MVNRRNSNPTETAFAPDQTLVEKRLNNFVESLSEVLLDITAVEVNTMIVERITGDKFIPWETYRDIYPISRQYLHQQGIHKSLRDRYLEIRKNLELEYVLLLTNKESDLYDPAVIENCPILTNSTVEIDQIKSLLPNPEEILKVQKLLNNSRFLRSLRKISELKAALDNHNKSLLKIAQEQRDDVVKTDIIYAQTVIQLDGNIINRYSKEIFDHPRQDLIIQLHKQGVEAGEKQWRGLIRFVVDLIQNSVVGGFGRQLLPLGRNQSKGS